MKIKFPLVLLLVVFSQFAVADRADLGLVCRDAKVLEAVMTAVAKSNNLKDGLKLRIYDVSYEKSAALGVSCLSRLEIVDPVDGKRLDDVGIGFVVTPGAADKGPEVVFWPIR